MPNENLPLVTVICNCYNHEAFVTEALQSVLDQTYTNIKLIVVNNGSRDHSANVIKEFIEQHPEVVFINNNAPLYHTAVFNKAVKISKGKYLIDLSGDDRLLPHCIETQVSFFNQQDKDVGLIFGNSYYINEKGDVCGVYFDVDENNKVLNKNLFNTSYASILKGGHCLNSVSAMMSRKHFENLGGYDEDLFFEDLDYWLRLTFNKLKIIFLDEILVEKRVLKSSMQHQFHLKNETGRKMNHSLRKIYRSAIERNNTPENKSLLKRIHYSMHQCYHQKNWKDLIRFSLIEITCRKHIYFRKSKNS